MTIETIIDALRVTDANVKEMLEIFEGKLSKDETAGFFLETVDQYDKERGEGSFKKLAFIDQILLPYRHALLRGYVQALKDVQTVQHSELEHMDA